MATTPSLLPGLGEVVLGDVSVLWFLAVRPVPRRFGLGEAGLSFPEGSSVLSLLGLRVTCFELKACTGPLVVDV